MRKRRSFYYYTKRFPPCLVRLLARTRHGGPLADEYIAHESGLPIHQVLVISQMTNWKGVDLDTVRAFTHGCGLDLDDPVSIKRKIVYLSGKHSATGERTPARFSYLKRSPNWITIYKPLIERWRQSVVQ